MSSFSTLERSAEQSRPIEIYRLSIGTNEYLYTSASSDVVLASTTYESIPIKRGEIVIGQAERKKVLKVSVPASNVFARKYIGIPPGQKPLIEIWRLQLGETPTFATRVSLYQGTVVNVEFPTVALSEISALPIEAAVGRSFPRYSSMPLCNHTVYGPGCDVNPTPHTFTGTITAVSGNQITVAGAGATGFNFTGGFVKLTGDSDFRVVLAHSANNLRMMIPFDGEVVGATVDCVRGCNHAIFGDCATVFDNVIRNGGFAFVPNVNIFKRGLVVQ